MLKEIKTYESEYGNVSLMRDMGGYSVLLSKYLNGYSSIMRCRARSFADIELALDQYRDFIEFLHGRQPVNMCSCKSRRQSCSAKNCPKKLGGVAYWQLFRNSCLYRTR